MKISKLRNIIREEINKELLREDKVCEEWFVVEAIPCPDPPGGTSVVSFWQTSDCEMHAEATTCRGADRSDTGGPEVPITR
jgi:hypothetical protein